MTIRRKGRVMPAREVRTGDTVVYPVGPARTVTQARTREGHAVLSHGPNVTTTVPMNAPLRVVRPSRRVNHDIPVVVFSSANVEQ